MSRERRKRQSDQTADHREGLRKGEMMSGITCENVIHMYTNYALYLTILPMYVYSIYVVHTGTHTVTHAYTYTHPHTHTHSHQDTLV